MKNKNKKIHYWSEKMVSLWKISLFLISIKALKYSTEYLILLDVGLSHPIIPKSLSCACTKEGIIEQTRN